MYALGGDDKVHVHNNTELVATELYGGPGDDELKGGRSEDLLDGGPGNVLLGGPGDDKLDGGKRRDIMIGGFGKDEFKAHQGEDLLIAGVTVFDNDLATLVTAIQAEWTSDRDFQTRVANLQGVGTGPRENGSIFLRGGVTVFNDPTVRVREPDGLTPEGISYYDFTDLVIRGTLQPGELTGERTSAFYNPNRIQFTYDLVFFGRLNQAPQITTVPDVEALADRPYSYDADARNGGSG